MERKNEIILVVFFMVVVAFSIYVLWSLDFFYNLIEGYVRRFGLVAVFFLSLLADAIEKPIGPEAVDILAVLFGLNVLAVFLLSALGSFFGGLIGFYVGKYFLSDKIAASCSVGKYEKYCRFFMKYGRLGLAVGALTPLPYVTFCWFSGAFHLKVRDYLIFGFLPRALRIGVVLLAFKGVLSLFF